MIRSNCLRNPSSHWLSVTLLQIISQGCSFCCVMCWVMAWYAPRRSPWSSTDGATRAVTHTMAAPSMRLRSITTTDLALMLNSDCKRTLFVLDLRPASAYKTCRIIDAVNLNCPAILLRRLQKERRPCSFPSTSNCSNTLNQLISTCSFSNGCDYTTAQSIVLYDECDENITTRLSPMTIIYSALNREFSDVFVLEGACSVIIHSSIAWLTLLFRGVQ